jgi:hypothetical protein
VADSVGVGLAMPGVGEDRDFERPEDLGRPVEL